MAFNSILQTLTGNGSTAVIKARGRFLLAACPSAAGFDGGSLKVEISPDDGASWAPLGSPITVATAIEVVNADGGQLRATLSGATAPNLLIGISPILYVP